MPHQHNHLPDTVSLDSLVAIFYAEPSQLARFKKIAAGALSDVYGQLLNHTSHMTVTVESFYNDRVDVSVLRSQTNQDHYCREILLSTQSTGKVVQYGIVRLKLDLITEPARSEIYPNPNL